MIADKAVQSSGPLFTNPDPDEARTYFRSKSRTKAGKLMSLRQAVERFVHD
jgi:glutaconate CoA-transferase subunit A